MRVSCALRIVNDEAGQCQLLLQHMSVFSSTQLQTVTTWAFFLHLLVIPPSRNHNSQLSRSCPRATGAADLRFVASVLSRCGRRAVAVRMDCAGELYVRRRRCYSCL